MPATRFAYEPTPEAQPTPGLLLSKSIAILLDLIFPPRRAGCEKVDWHWCPACQHAINQLPFPSASEFAAGAPVEAVASTGIHEDHLQKAIWSLKYANGRELAVPLGQRMNQRLDTLDWTIDILIPVPLHTRRLHERGYNQSQLLGEVVAHERGLPLMPHAVHRLVDTQPQVSLNAQQRQANMEAAFQADPQLVAGRSVLLIDDVYTTGATLRACAQAARDAGASRVYGLTITQARSHLS